MSKRRFRTILLGLCIVWIAGILPTFAAMEQGTYGKNRQPSLALPVGDPISAASGCVFFSLPLLDLGGPMDLDFTLIYDQDSFNMGAIGFSYDIASFWHSQAVMVTLEADIGGLNYIHLPNGVTLNFKKNESGDLVLKEDATTYPGNALPLRYQMKDTAKYVYVLDPAEESVYIAEKAPCDFMPNKYRLRFVLDRNGNQLVYEYDATNACELVRIHDTLGRSLNFTYRTVEWLRVLNTVTDQDGRQVQFTFEYPAEDNGNNFALRSVTDPMNQTTTFYYQSDVLSGNIKEVKYPKGNIPYSTVFARHGVTLPGFQEQIAARAVSQTDAYGHVTQMSYASDAYRTTVTYPDAKQEVYLHSGAHTPPIGLTDKTGAAVAFSVNAKNQITSLTDRMGGATSFTYHTESGKIASATNAEGKTVSYTYTAQDQTFTNPANSETVTFTFYNLTQIDYPDTNKEQFSYDSRGNVLTRTDRNGKVWEYAYNTKGRVLTEENPAGGVTTYEYNPDGTLASKTDSDTGKITYQYDAHKRIRQITYPDSSAYTISYNANDFITQITDQKGVVTAFEYDDNQNLIGRKRAVGTLIEQSAAYEYDLMDRMIRFTNPAGKATQYEYTYWGAVKKITYPDMALLTFGYDDRNRLIQVTDEAGKILTASRDDEAVFTGFKSPANRQVTLGSDKLGYFTQFTDPGGNVYKIERDAMEQIVKVIDPLNREMTAARDGEGRITSVTLPVIGAVIHPERFGADYPDDGSARKELGF